MLEGSNLTDTYGISVYIEKHSTYSIKQSRYASYIHIIKACTWGALLSKRKRTISMKLRDSVSD